MYKLDSAQKKINSCPIQETQRRRALFPGQLVLLRNPNKSIQSFGIISCLAYACRRFSPDGRGRCWLHRIYGASTVADSPKLQQSAIEDIGYGLHFIFDVVVDGLNPGACSFYQGSAVPDVKNVCVFRKMFSLREVWRTTSNQVQ